MGRMAREAVAAGLVVVLTCGVGCGAGEVSVAREGGTASGGREFAVDLYQHLKDAEGNLFFSPLSIRTALGMTYAGARTKTADEMARVLRLPRDQKKAHAALGKLLDDLEKASAAEGCELSIANALWGQSGEPFLKSFLDLVKNAYGAPMNLVDFARDTEGARRTINRWVEKKTKDKIKELLKEGDVDGAVLVLTNAIYFKGDWAEAFEKKHTRDAPFFVTTDEKVSVPMMHKTADFGYAATEDLQALELPYKGDRLSMVVLLPRKRDGLDALETRLTAKDLDQWLTALGKRKVVVSLPKFTTTVRFELKKPLKKMGMPMAFGPGADFSGMNGTPGDLFISKVIHKAFVDVNEEGTEAAAATAVIMIRGAAPAPPPVFRADHPFIYLIRDRKSGSILFMGRVVNPKT